MTTEHFTFNIPTTISDDVRAWTDEAIADCINEENKYIAVAEHVRGRMTMELTRRLQERGAQELLHPTLEVKLDPGTPRYFLPTLHKVKEIISPEEWDKAFMPEHEETVLVEAKLDMKKARHWPKRFGKDVAAIFEEALLPSAPRLIVKAKEPAQAQ